jgi:hypothetical protein
MSGPPGYDVTSFVCPGCGAIYECSHHHRTARDESNYSCEICGAVVHSWKNNTDYMDFRIRLPSPQSEDNDDGSYIHDPE